MGGGSGGGDGELLVQMNRCACGLCCRLSVRAGGGTGAQHWKPKQDTSCREAFLPPL